MKKVCLLLCVCVLLILYKLYTPRFHISTSLAKGEIAITFLGEDVLLYSSSKTSFLLELQDIMVDKYIQMYNLGSIPIFTLDYLPDISDVPIYKENNMIKIVNGKQSFCIMGTKDCTFNYIYENQGNLDGSLYFYRNQTAPYLENTIHEKYNVSNQIITLIFNGKDYMLFM